MEKKEEFLSVLDIASDEEIKKITQFAEKISKTPYCPDRFFEKNIIYKTTADGKFIYSQDKNRIIEKIESVPKIEHIVHTILYGREIGLSPIQSLKSIIFLNGVPTMFGDTMMAIVAKSGLLTRYDYHYDGNFGEDDYKCVVTIRRKDRETAVVTEFSLGDAIRANLWSRNTKEENKKPWFTYPKRMLLNRCRTYALREVFPDILGGLSSYEEMQDVYNVIEDNKLELENVDNCKNSIMPTSELAVSYAQFEKSLARAKDIKELEDVYALVQEDSNLNDEEQQKLSEVFRQCSAKFVNNINLNLDL